ncbi:hypothetical protein AN219_10205 [Streptomyces nanshensis]|nr:hypothetical protein AN219_10205 [Streptomyces nanshensis]
MDDLLASLERESPVRSFAVLARILEKEFAAVHVSFLITDLGGRAVVRLPGHTGGADGGPEPLALAGTVYGHVIHTQRLWTGPAEHTAVDAAGSPLREGEWESAPAEGGPEAHDDEPTKVVAPVTDRGDAIGLLELTLPSRPDRGRLERIREAAHALAYVVIVNRRFTDLYEWGRRTTRLSLASEIQHRLLPESFTCDAGPFTVAGSLEPAANIGGDTFDYTLGERGLTLTLTDAMGHDVRAAQLATVVVAALRNARRAGRDLLTQAHAANEAVIEHAVREQRAVTQHSPQVQHALAAHGAQAMVTGQLMWVDFETGEAAFVNAGHTWPLLLRDREAQELTALIDLPFGIEPHAEYRLQNIALRPGDRLVLITDGMLEPDQDDRSLRRLVEATASEHPREAVQTFTRSVLTATDHDPRDDATVLCLDWHNSTHTSGSSSAA